MSIKNLKNTSGDKGPVSGSWTKSANIYDSELPKICCVKNCKNKVDVGAHVLYYENGGDRCHYIALLCYQHNNYQNTNEMLLKPGTNIIRKTVLVDYIKKLKEISKKDLKNTLNCELSKWCQELELNTSGTKLVLVKRLQDKINELRA